MAELDINALQQRVEQAVEGARVKVTTDGYAYSFEVVSEIFSGLRPVARQQMVYRALTPLIADGTLHAVNIRAITPQES